MKVVNVIKIHLWKSRETLYCLFFDRPEIELVRLEHSIPRVKVNEKHGEMIENVWHDSARLIVRLTTVEGKHSEVVASLNLSHADSMKTRGSISIYDHDLEPEIKCILTNSTVELLRYEI